MRLFHCRYATSEITCLLLNRLGADEASAGLDAHKPFKFVQCISLSLCFFVLARALPGMCCRSNHKGKAERIAEPDVEAISTHVKKAGHIT